jgi:hypothetical protein
MFTVLFTVVGKRKRQIQLKLTDLTTITVVECQHGVLEVVGSNSAIPTFQKT